MKTRRRRRRIEDTLRAKLQKFKRDHLLEHEEFGSYSEKVRAALDTELTNDPTTWPVAFLGRQAIIEFFMSAVWRDDTAAHDDSDGQLSFRYTFNGKPLPSDITYYDRNAGRHKMRTVAIESARIWQWQLAVELQFDKAQEVRNAASKNQAIGVAMLDAAGGDANKLISDVWDNRFDDAAC